jgi:hypothetical protein
MALCERDRAVLDLERTWWQEGATKSQVVKGRLGLSLSRYNQLLGQLVGRKDAEEYDPLLVRRLRRAKFRQRWRAYNGYNDSPATRPRER